MDRVFELMHDDTESYRKMLAVIHLVKRAAEPADGPPMIVRVVGKWLAREDARRADPDRAQLRPPPGTSDTPCRDPGRVHEQRGTRLRRTLDGVRLHVGREGEGPLVILVHGFPELWYSWRIQMPAIARAGYRVVALDQRGYGRSSKFWRTDALPHSSARG